MTVQQRNRPKKGATKMGKIEPQQLPEREMRSTARIAYNRISEYFAIPENERKFEEWKAKRAEING